MKKIILTLTLILSSAFILTVLAQTAKGDSQKNKKSKTSNNKTFKGTLVQMPWTKSGESYCAGGSEYFVLKTSDGKHILQTDSNKVWETLKKKSGQIVTIVGSLEEKRIEPNPMEQAPLDMDGKVSTYTCDVLRVLTIK